MSGTDRLIEKTQTMSVRGQNVEVKIPMDGLVEVSQDSEEYWVRTPRFTTDKLGVSSSKATHGAF